MVFCVDRDYSFRVRVITSSVFVCKVLTDSSHVKGSYGQRLRNQRCFYANR